MFIMSNPKGYAASVDSQARYTTGQARWLQFSAEVIEQLSAKFSRIQLGFSGNRSILEELVEEKQEMPPERLDFRSILEELGQKRQQIAQELKHGEDDKIRDVYGQFRDELICEPFFENNPDAVWVSMAPKVFAAIDEMAKTTREHGIKTEDGALAFTHESVIRYTCGRPLLSDDKGSWRGSILEDKTFIRIRAPFSEQPNYSRLLAGVQLVDKKGEPRVISITYAEFSKEAQVGDFNIATEFLQGMLSSLHSGYPGFEVHAVYLANSKVELNELTYFLYHAGNFCHLMAQILPFRRGTAGIMEWIIRAAAHSRGINLGPFNLSEGLSWDFKALITPNRHDYAIWFMNNCFLEPKLESKIHSKPPGP